MGAKRENYDVVIIGGSTTGSYFARRMAERGHSVLVLESAGTEDISPAYDIFHMGRDEMKLFRLPEVHDGDGVFAFSFEQNTTYSSFGRWPKPGVSPVIGMHKHGYIRLMNRWAQEAGAEYLYHTTFTGFTFDDRGKVDGVKFICQDGSAGTVGCRLAADCSGLKAAGRMSLPDDYGIEKFELTPDDVFYVVLRYVKFAQKQTEKWLRSDSWVWYKTWLSPSGDDADAILGIGANSGFDCADRVFGLFSKNVALPAYTVTKTERGVTPYHRSLYSFVADRFIAMGDAACLTKPFNGEGCTSSMVQADLAVDAAARALAGGEYPTREALWPVNYDYNRGQGRDFAMMMPVLAVVLRHSAQANDYLFKNDIVFSKKIMAGSNGNISVNAADLLTMLVKTIAGIASGELNMKSLCLVAGSLPKALLLMLHYGRFPATPDGFEKWVSRADRLWSRAGRMSDWTPGNGASRLS